MCLLITQSTFHYTNETGWTLSIFFIVFAFVRLNDCNPQESCHMMGHVNISAHSGLREMNLSANAVLDSGLKPLSVALSPLSGLQSLR